MEFKLDYGIREGEPGHYIATHGNFDMLCPHIMPTPTYVEQFDDKGEVKHVRFPQENTVYGRQLCTSVCAKFHISKKADKHQLHCKFNGDVAHDLNPASINLLPKAPAEKEETLKKV